MVIIVLVIVIFLVVRSRRRRQDDNTPELYAELFKANEEAIEWEDITAHAPYKPKHEAVDTERLPFKKGDKIKTNTLSMNKYNRQG